MNDYRPVALTPVIMKCFERLVLANIKACIPPTHDQHQFAYKANRSTDDAVTLVIHKALSHLENLERNPNIYVRMLFVDFSSAFNSISPCKLVIKLQGLGIQPHLCLWIKDFLTNRPQKVRLGQHTSTTITLNTGVPQGCVLSPFLYSLFTSDCISHHSSNTVIKFADDTTIIGQIANNDEGAYREEVSTLAEWCRDNDLILNTKKTKEIVIDFRRDKPCHRGLCIGGEEVERVSSFKFLGVNISENLSWSLNATCLVKKAQKRLFFLRKLKRNGLPQNLLINFYRSTIESILTYGCTAWYSSCTDAERKDLQRVVKTAQWIIGSPLPHLSDIYSSRLHKRALKISRDPSHPGHHLSESLPSGRLKVIKARTNRLSNSFFPKAVKTLLSSHARIHTRARMHTRTH